MDKFKGATRVDVASDYARSLDVNLEVVVIP